MLLPRWTPQERITAAKLNGPVEVHNRAATAKLPKQGDQPLERDDEVSTPPAELPESERWTAESFETREITRTIFDDAAASVGIATLTQITTATLRRPDGRTVILDFADALPT